MESRIPKEATNSARLDFLLRTVCSDLLREVLLQHPPTPYADIYAAIRSQESYLKPLLDKNQELLLYPSHGTSSTNSVERFDLTLLYLLIRNFSKVPAPRTRWGQPVTDSPRDTSIGANVERIRCLKNAITGHSAEGGIKDTDFVGYLEQIIEFVKDMELNLRKTGFLLQIILIATQNFDPVSASRICSDMRNNLDIQFSNLTDVQQKLDTLFNSFQFFSSCQTKQCETIAALTEKQDIELDILHELKACHDAKITDKGVHKIIAVWSQARKALHASRKYSTKLWRRLQQAFPNSGYQYLSEPWVTEMDRPFLNSVKLQIILADTVPEALREIFEREWNAKYGKDPLIGPWKDDGTSVNTFRIIEENHYIPNFQRRLLKRALAENPQSLEQWDISLWCSALLDSHSINLNSSNKALVYSIDRVRDIRNAWVHSAGASLQDAKYCVYVRRIEQALHEMGCRLFEVPSPREECMYARTLKNYYKARRAAFREEIYFFCKRVSKYTLFSFVTLIIAVAFFVP